MHNLGQEVWHLSFNTWNLPHHASMSISSSADTIGNDWDVAPQVLMMPHHTLEIRSWLCHCSVVANIVMNKCRPNSGVEVEGEKVNVNSY